VTLADGTIVNQAIQPVSDTIIDLSVVNLVTGENIIQTTG